MMPSTLRLKPNSQTKIQPSVQPEIEDQTYPLSLKLKSQKNPEVISSEFPEEGENDLERDIERNIARGTSRILEIGAGMPGDLYSFGKFLLGADPETNLPTSKSLKEFSEKASLGYTKAKSAGEEKSDEILQDIASFMIPGAGKYNLVRNIGIPVVANLAKEGIKYAGGDKSAEAAKIGTMIALDLMNLKSGGAKKYAGSLFQESEKLIPEGATLSSQKFQKSLSGLEKTLESGGSRPSTEKALTKVGELQKKMKDGKIEVKELIDFRKSINEIKDSLGGFDVNVPMKIKKKMIANLDLVKKEVIGALDEYGRKYNPEFGKLNKAANESYAAYESSDKMASFIKKTMKDSVKNPSLKAVLGLSGVGYGAIAHGATLAKGAAVGGLPLYGAYQGYKVLHQVVQSPTLRKFYGNILKGAASGNASQVIKNTKALEKEMDKEKNGHQVSG